MDTARRYVIVPESMPPVCHGGLTAGLTGGLNDFPRQDIVLVAGEAPGIKSGLLAALTAGNFRVRQVTWGQSTQKVGENRFTAERLSEKAVEALQQMIRPSGERVGAVINLAGFDPQGRTDPTTQNGGSGLFTLLKAFEADLKESARQRGGLVVNITALGGRFGLNAAAHIFSEEAAATLGVAKSAAREWPNVRIRCIDVDPDMESDMAAAMLWEELSADEACPETGIDRQGRWRLGLEEKPRIAGAFEAGSESVILILGGASGITGEIARALAHRYQPRMILVGRTSMTETESAETTGITDRHGLRSFFIQSAKRKIQPVTPVEIDRRIARILKQRRIAENLETMRSSGALVEYHDLDVKDPLAMKRLVMEIYRRWGRIDGVIHGAGIIDDRRIREKSLESFEAVYDTKVVPARVLAQCLDPSTLKFLVFFSSVAARFGNAGQCDYSAANEVLNKLAGHLAKKWTTTRVTSIGWGPWEMGMVNSGLKKIYREKGIRLISADTGVSFFFNELGPDTDDAAEIVVTSAAENIMENGLGPNP